MVWENTLFFLWRLREARCRQVFFLEALSLTAASPWVLPFLTHFSAPTQCPDVGSSSSIRALPIFLWCNSDVGRWSTNSPQLASTFSCSPFPFSLPLFLPVNWGPCWNHAQVFALLQYKQNLFANMLGAVRSLNPIDKNPNKYRIVFRRGDEELVIAVSDSLETIGKSLFSFSEFTSEKQWKYATITIWSIVCSEMESEEEMNVHLLPCVSLTLTFSVMSSIKLPPWRL